MEALLKELVVQYPAAEDCISWAIGDDIVLKKVSGERELVKSFTLLSSTKVTLHLMHDWSIGIPKHLTLCLLSALHAGAVSNCAAKENKVKNNVSMVSGIASVCNPIDYHK